MICIAFSNQYAAHVNWGKALDGNEPGLAYLRDSGVNERLAGGWLTIDLDALVRNWQTLNERSGNADSGAVVKADAYGLGIEPVVTALYDAGCRSFFTAMPEEGAKAKQQAPDAEVFVFCGPFAGSEAYFAESGLIPVLNSLEQIDLWATFWRERGSRRPCALHIDTGMNRLGLSVEEARSLAADIPRKHSITPILMMSHLACGDDPSHPLNHKQLMAFNEVCDLFPGTERSLANSAGHFIADDYFLDVTRPGIALYGGEFINGQPPLETVVSLSARIIQVREAKKGETVGYGATHKLERDSRIAIVATGYADGYHRAVSGCGVSFRDVVSQGAQGAIGKRLVPCIGRVSMDLAAFDVTDLAESDLASTDWIELIGDTIKLDDVARAAGTIGYEVLTGLRQRYHRVYSQTNPHA